MTGAGIEKLKVILKPYDGDCGTRIFKFHNRPQDSTSEFFVWLPHWGYHYSRNFRDCIKWLKNCGVEIQD